MRRRRREPHCANSVLDALEGAARVLASVANDPDGGEFDATILSSPQDGIQIGTEAILADLKDLRRIAFSLQERSEEEHFVLSLDEKESVRAVRLSLPPSVIAGRD